MVNFIQCNQVIGVNGQNYIYQNYVTGLVCGPNDPQTVKKQLSTANMVIINSFWKIPRVQSGRVIGYAEETAINTSVQPTADSIKFLRIKNLQDLTEYDIAINLTDNIGTSSPPNQFAFDADGLGGILPVMPTVVIPFPIIQSPAQTNVGGVGTFVFTLPLNPLGLMYSIPAPWFNGVAPGSPYAPSGITTPAGFVTWANANWTAYGTWANPTGNVITLASSTVKAAGFIAALTPAPWCFNLAPYSTPALVNQIKFGSGGTLISVPAFELTNNGAVLQSVLQNHMSAESTNFIVFNDNKLQVNTTQAQPELYNSGVLVLASGSGVCS